MIEYRVIVDGLQDSNYPLSLDSAVEVHDSYIQQGYKVVWVEPILENEDG